MTEPSDRWLAHRAVRKAHGPGRVEFVFDRQMSFCADMAEQIGKIILPSHRFPELFAGRVVERDGVRLRVLVQHTRLSGAIVMKHQPMAPMVPPPTFDRDRARDIEMRIRSYGALSGLDAMNFGWSAAFGSDGLGDGGDDG